MPSPELSGLFRPLGGPGAGAGDSVGWATLLGPLSVSVVFDCDSVGLGCDVAGVVGWIVEEDERVGAGRVLASEVTLLLIPLLLLAGAGSLRLLLSTATVLDVLFSDAPAREEETVTVRSVVSLQVDEKKVEAVELLLLLASGVAVAGPDTVSSHEVELSPAGVDTVSSQLVDVAAGADTVSLQDVD